MPMKAADVPACGHPPREGDHMPHAAIPSLIGVGSSVSEITTPPEPPSTPGSDGSASPDPG
ncbi:hypothetical protein CYJ73_00510 [Gordonia terrae]|uniref:Uncharacterized protein n=1 Tax=Gordonia terrae TaxID=2055 RepID=A0A2I1RDM8_9ACTN|nr:hypothetical protein CYJ73_00510 [Gordonia terrae]